MWARLRDVHEALGLRYQWGGSHCNKALLGCLGIDTRNIVSSGKTFVGVAVCDPAFAPPSSSRDRRSSPSSSPCTPPAW